MPAPLAGAVPSGRPLAQVGFPWPVTASPRCLGAIVSHLARAGLIIETGWTKGRTARSHAGRVSLWRKAVIL